MMSKDRTVTREEFMKNFEQKMNQVFFFINMVKYLKDLPQPLPKDFLETLSEAASSCSDDVTETLLMCGHLVAQHIEIVDEEIRRRSNLEVYADFLKALNAGVES